MDAVRAERLQKKYNYAAKAKTPQRRGGGGRYTAQKPKNAKRTFIRLAEYVKDFKYKLILAFFCILAQTISSLAASYILRPAINEFIALDGGDPRGLLMILALMGAVYLVSVVAAYFEARVMLDISQKTLKKLRSDLFDKLQKLPVRFYDTNTTGEIMSRFANDVDTIGELLNHTLPGLISGFITFTGSFLMMLYISVPLTVMAIIFIPIAAYMIKFLSNKCRTRYSAQQAALGILNGFIEETVSGQKVVKVFCHEDIAEDEFDFLNHDLRRKQIRAQTLGGAVMPIMNNFSNLLYTFTAGIGAILVITRGFDYGGLTVFINISKHFTRPVNDISAQMSTVYSALSGAERVFAIMDSDPEPEDEPDAVELKDVKGNVEFKNVTFGYLDDTPVLKNVSLSAHRGQKVAFVGSTGAGKTTIVNLLTRFYDIWEGAITLDGIDLRDIKRDSLRKNIAMVLQDAHLFTDTVMENIRYGRPDATDEEVIAAAKTANAHGFIMQLADGYNTVLERDGLNLSQGQRQLMNIARAAITRSPILILDEATSSVDTKTERNIQIGLDRLMKDRTTFVIAHRLATVRNADIIMVLEHGEIIERGTHEELLALKGRYYELHEGLAELD